jgi:uncharacterized protein YbaR (Trm112 family)
MRLETLDILRCPYCGSRLEFVPSVPQRRTGNEIEDAVLQCKCSWFPIVAGIPVMHLEPPVPAALAHLEAGDPELAKRAMFNLSEDESRRFEAVLTSGRATYATVVDSLGPNYERGYFLYRFSDPSYLVAHALIRAVAAATLKSGGRAIDLCGGSGHLTRAMMDLSAEPPVLADLYFTKVWLGRTFTAAGCEGVCCHADAPLPFSRSAFRYAMCADAFMFIWTKRQLVQEMLRLVDHPDGTVVISHTHNELQWSESLGQALPPDGYRELFETLEPRMFSEERLFKDVVRGGPLDLTQSDPPDALERDPALSIVAARNPALYRPYPLEYDSGSAGEWRLNPLYRVERRGEGVRLTLHFPSIEYEEEFGACREYLPETLDVDAESWAALCSGHVPDRLRELVKRRVIVDLPKNYY